jgi:hypothetical protein
MKPFISKKTVDSLIAAIRSDLCLFEQSLAGVEVKEGLIEIDFAEVKHAAACLNARLDYVMDKLE